jgi:hypothetical protein
MLIDYLPIQAGDQQRIHGDQFPLTGGLVETFTAPHVVPVTVIVISGTDTAHVGQACWRADNVHVPGAAEENPVQGSIPAGRITARQSSADMIISTGYKFSHGSPSP